MTATDHIAAAPRGSRTFRTLRKAVVSRLAGPGGYYNIGNLIGLATGVGLPLTTLAGDGNSGTDGIVAYFVGSPASGALTIATLIFLASGEMYHRAWTGADAPRTDLNRFADLLSALGALAVMVSLAYLNQPVLAVLTGILIAGGKLGSAVYADQPGLNDLWPSHWPDLFRSMVLAGRLFGMVAAMLGLALTLGIGGPLAAATQSAVILVCHLFWIRADILLFRGKDAT